MTKEQITKYKHYSNNAELQTAYEWGYKDGAEPREKRITELKYQLTHRNCLDCSNHSSKLRMRNLDLEKENAELKGLKDVATLIRANNDTVVTLMQLNNKLVSKSQQLIKAKDHIKKLLACLQQDTNDPQTNYYVVKYMSEAEQFIKDSEVEK